MFNATRLDPHSLQVNTSYDNPFVFRFLRSAPGTSYHSVSIFLLYIVPPPSYCASSHLTYCTSYYTSSLLYLLSRIASSLLLYFLLHTVLSLSDRRRRTHRRLFRHHEADCAAYRSLYRVGLPGTEPYVTVLCCSDGIDLSSCPVLAIA